VAERWRIELFGGLRVEQGGQALPRLETRKAGALLAYLALHPGRSHPRETLAELLWPEEDPRATLPRLRQTLSLVRRALEPADSDDGSVLIADRAVVRLNPEAVTTDVAEFGAAVQAAERTSDVGERIRLLIRAEEQSRGEFLAGYEEAWIAAEQAHLAERRIEALTGLAEALAEAGNPAAGIDYAREAVRADPVREETHRSLMRLYAAAGRTSEALRQYRELERVLRDELGAAPDAATRDLFSQLQAATHPSPSAVSAPRDNVLAPNESLYLNAKQQTRSFPVSSHRKSNQPVGRIRSHPSRGILATVAALAVLSLGLMWSQRFGTSPRSRRSGQPPPSRPAPSVSSPVQDEAESLYRQGRDAWNRRSEAGFQAALANFQQAISKNPEHAPAFSGLADTYGLMGYYGFLPPRESKEKAKAAAEEARRLDPEAVETLTSLAWIHMAFDRDWPAAERAFLAAIARDDSYATAHQWYSLFLMTRGRTQDSLREIQKARELEELSRVIVKSLGQRYYYARKYDKAVPIFKDILIAEPTSSLTRYWLALTYEQEALRLRQSGKRAEATAKFQAAEREFRLALRHAGKPLDPSILAGLGHLHGVRGNRVAATRSLQELMALKRQRYVSPVALAEVSIGLGQFDQALRWLEAAEQEASPELILLRIEPRFDPLRPEDRFIQLIKSLGLE
jgi:DNA-binding SARP family transcriptional activator